MTHWIPWLTIHSLAEDWRFDRYGIPMELYKLIQLVQWLWFYDTTQYLQAIRAMYITSDL